MLLLQFPGIPNANVFVVLSSNFFLPVLKTQILHCKALLKEMSVRFSKILFYQYFNSHYFNYYIL